jgi:hypothetical protein
MMNDSDAVHHANEFDDEDSGMQEALQQGYREGKQAGQDSGFQEGRRLGQVSGVNYGMELGFAMGMVEAVQDWMKNQQHQHQQEHQPRKKNHQEPNGQAQAGIQRHHCGDNMALVYRIEKTVQNLEHAIQDFPNLQDLFHRQPQSSIFDNRDTTTTSTDYDTRSSMSQNESDGIRQKLQRIRTLCKLLATKLGMPHHSFLSVLQQQQQQQQHQQSSQLVNNVDSSLMTETKNNYVGINNHQTMPPQYPVGNGMDTTEW